MIDVMREPPSGAVATPVSAPGVVGYAAAAPVSIVVLPAGHLRGLYTVGFEAFVRTVAGAGSVNGALTWTLPNGVATSISIGLGVVTALGNRLAAFRSIPSNGSAPLVWTLTPAGVVGSPVIDATVYAELSAYNP